MPSFLAEQEGFVKFMFSQKATKIDQIFTVDLTFNTKCQIDSEGFIDFCGLLRKHELYRLYSLNSYTYSYSGFPKDKSHSQGFSHENIRIMTADESTLQLIQLPGIEVCA